MLIQGVSAIIPGLAFIPLSVFAIRRNDVLRILMSGIGGALASILVGFVWLTAGSGGHAETAIWAFALMLSVGGPVGAYMGVVIAEATSGDRLRRGGARIGALYGMSVGLALCVALWLILDLPGRALPLPLVLSAVAALSTAAGALFGSELALTQRLAGPTAVAARVGLHAGYVLLITLAVAGAVHQRQTQTAAKARREALTVEQQLRREPLFELNTALLDELDSTSASVRASAAEDLGKGLYPRDRGVVDPRVVPALMKATGDGDRSVRVAAVRGLGDAVRAGHIHQNREPLDALLTLRDSRDPDVKRAVAQQLTRLRGGAAR